MINQKSKDYSILLTVIKFNSKANINLIDQSLFSFSKMNLNDENNDNNDNDKNLLSIQPNAKPHDFGDESDIKISTFNILMNNDEESDDKDISSSPKKHTM